MKLSNKNHLKNINDQNFGYFMREVTTKGGYDKGFYGTLIKVESLNLSL